MASCMETLSIHIRNWRQGQSENIAVGAPCVKRFVPTTSPQLSANPKLRLIGVVQICNALLSKVRKKTRPKSKHEDDFVRP